MKNLFKILRRNYDQRVIEYFNKVDNTELLDRKSDDVGTGVVGSMACGDMMRL